MSLSATPDAPFSSLGALMRAIGRQIEFSPIFISDASVAVAYSIATASLIIATDATVVASPHFLALAAIIALAQVAKVGQVIALGRRGGDARAYEKSGALVTDGAYGFSRNPTYLITFVQNLFWSALLIHEPGVFQAMPGLALAAFAIPVLHFLAIDKWVIPKEEADLRRSHADEFAAYCARVNRWFGSRAA